MIVGFDGTVLNGSRTGIGYYTHFLIQHLLRHREGLELLAFDGLRMNPPVLEDPAPEATGHIGGRRRSAILARVRQMGLARKLWRTLKAVGFRHAARRLDLFHATNYLPPARTDIPVLPLIHDVSHLRHPEWHPIERVRWLENRSDEFGQAPLINTVSQFSAGEIAATLGIAPERIHVTYPGINPAYQREGEEDAGRLAAVAVEPGRFFLCVGTLEPRKNLTTAIEAYSRLPQAVQQRFPLLVAGPQGWGDLALPQSARQLERCGALRFLGYVDEPSMRALYRFSTAFLFPSSYEGFGMPVSEAMATGTRPIIAAGGAPEEVAGPLGLARPAFDVDAWSLAMTQAIEEGWHEDAKLRRALHDASTRFSWATNAEATKRLYEMISNTDRKQPLP